MTARAKLKTTQAEIATLTAEIGRLEKAQSEARTQAREAQDALSGYEKLDGVVAKWRAGAVKAGNDPRKLPDELKKKLAGRKAAEDELGQSTGTLEILSDELGEANAKLKPLLGKAEQLTLETLHEETIQPLATELIALKQHQLELEMLLGSFPASSPLITRALASYRFDFGADPKLPMSVRWRIRIDALKRDGSAAASAPKPVTPSDFAGLSEGGYRYPNWRDEDGKVVCLPC
jgi:uncharacterized small protein (DUF1192 family)